MGDTSPEAVQLLHYACALSILLFSAVFLSRVLFQEKAKNENTAGSRHIIACILIFSSYTAEAIFLVSRDHNAPTTSQSRLVHILVCSLVWLGLSSQHLTARLLLGTALVSLVFEVPLVVLTHLRSAWLTAETLDFCFQSGRLLVFLYLSLYAVRQLWHSSRSGRIVLGEEAQPFLESQTESSVAYGAVPPSSSSDADGDGKDGDSDNENDTGDVAKIKKRRAERLKEKGGWIGYLRDFKVFVPYLVPRHDRTVQFCYLVCLLCLIAARVLNILLPRQIGLVVDRLVVERKAPYADLAIWLVLSLFREQTIEFIESMAKIPIEQFSYRQVTNAAFNHVMSLPMEFHADRDSAEVMRAIEQGHSLTNLLRSLILEILPTIVDLGVALCFLYYKFNIFASLIMLATGIAFVVLQTISGSWILGDRRDSAKASREEARVMHQAVQGWQTVTYFNMFKFESDRFGQAVETQLNASARYQRGSAYISSVVEALPSITFFLLACVVMYEISMGKASPGDFVFLMQYWDYLIWPIKWFAHTCRYLMSDLVDAERLLGLLQTKSSISDKPDAKDLRNVEGHVAFDNVGFAYDPRKPTVHELSIKASPGQTVALVGETGAGKSTIMKLLLRFYDVTSGRITIDGHDIRDITLDSLRSALGVVPQDPLLFNASILENLRYARPTASEAEIQDACRAAAIHDKILTFPDGYKTVVGEQGVKLSGGEIQRIAIARVFLKDPPILILDEATSAVDTHTESSIQKALEVLKKGRTTFVIAHRLSTIVRSDTILVIHDGRVSESGSHEELMKVGGRYHGLWTSQTAAGGPTARKEEEQESLI